MALPIMTSTEDLESVISFLKTKVAGATVAEAEAVIGGKALDGRKLSAYQTWGFISKDDNRLKLTAAGRELARADGEKRIALYRDAIRSIAPYQLIAEWVHYQKLGQVTNVDVAAHWYQHCPDDLGTTNEKTITDQAVCFFNLAEAAELGTRFIGRRGQTTRLEVSLPALAAFIEGSLSSEFVGEPRNGRLELEAAALTEPEQTSVMQPAPEESQPVAVGTSEPTANQRVFIAHGKNSAIVGQLKELLTFGKFIPVVAEEHETVSKPVSDKVLDDMESCFAGVIHIASEEELLDREGNVHHKINGNVLIEIGVALANYRQNVILLVEKGVHLPSNLQGLYRCEYQGDKLDYEATMKLLKTFNELK